MAVGGLQVRPVAEGESVSLVECDASAAHFLGRGFCFQHKGALHPSFDFADDLLAIAFVAYTGGSGKVFQIVEAVQAPYRYHPYGGVVVGDEVAAELRMMVRIRSLRRIFPPFFGRKRLVQQILHKRILGMVGCNSVQSDHRCAGFEG